MEGDLDKLAELVFNGDIKEKNSIQIQGDFETTKDLFEALLMCFTKGMRILYAEDGVVPLGKLTQDQFTTFITRFQSMGVTPIVSKYHIYQLFTLQGVEIGREIQEEWNQTKENYPGEIPLETLSDYTTTNSDKISDYYFQFQSENNYYVLHFSLL